MKKSTFGIIILCLVFLILIDNLESARRRGGSRRSRSRTRYVSKRRTRVNVNVGYSYGSYGGINPYMYHSRPSVIYLGYHSHPPVITDYRRIRYTICQKTFKIGNKTYEAIMCTNSKPYCCGTPGNQRCCYKLSTGAIVGIVFASIFFAGVVIGVIYYCCCTEESYYSSRRHRRSSSSSSSSSSSPDAVFVQVAGSDDLSKKASPMPPYGQQPAYPPQQPYPTAQAPPYPAQAPYPTQGQAPYPPQGPSPYPPQGQAPYPPQGQAPYPPQNGAPYPPPNAGSQAPPPSYNQFAQQQGGGANVPASGAPAVGSGWG